MENQTLCNSILVNSTFQVSELPEDNSPTPAGPTVSRGMYLGDKTRHVQKNTSLLKHDQVSIESLTTSSLISLWLRSRPRFLLV